VLHLPRAGVIAGVSVAGDDPGADRPQRVSEYPGLRRRPLMISTLLFDAGGTLVMPSFRRMADEYARDGVPVAPEQLARGEALVRLAFDRADFVRTHADPWLSFMHEIARLSGVERPPVAAFERLRAYNDSENLWEEVIAGTEPVLADLGTRYRLGVISNANGTVKKAFARLGIARFFDTIVDSAEVGVEKPDVRIFELALRQMNARATGLKRRRAVVETEGDELHGVGLVDRSARYDPEDGHCGL
jgi:HAD superfamily hydrolase (TIGR01509 family)